MHTSFWKRLLSLAIIASILSGLVLLSAPEAEAASSTGSTYADPATETELNKVPEWFAADNGANGQGAYAKLINGVVYVWGQNANYCLGITSYVDADGVTQTVKSGTVVPVPTAIPKSYFGGKKVTKIYMSYQTGVALTEDNKLYIWGGYLTSTLGLGTGQTPVQVGTSAVGSNQITDFKTSGFILYVKDATGQWYTCGTAGAAIYRGSLLLGEIGSSNYKVTTLTKVPSSISSACGGGIKDVAGEYQMVTIVLGKDNKLYGFGRDNSGNANCQNIGLADGVSYVTSPAKLCTSVSLFTKLTFTWINSEDQGCVAIDNTGSVWGWGANNSNRFGSSSNANPGKITSYSKIFDSNLYQKKAVRAWVSFRCVVVLCEDNTVYAIGSNPNGMIDGTSNASVTKMTQIFKTESTNYTFVGIYPSNTSLMGITKSGDMLFLGSNTYGGAADGTTSNDNHVAGQSTNVVSSAMPLSAPLTTNEVIFEIEVKESDGKTYYYRPTTKTADGSTNVVNGDSEVKAKKGRMLYERRESRSSTGYTLSALTLDAGSNFKLNVYFNDFGKMNTFVMPIRFNQNYVQVVNGAGEAYSTTSIVSPGSLGSSTGIIQDFDSTDWNGGYLATGTQSESYPKISNGGGWVSVMGYSYSDNPEIIGEVEMFSITFRATSTAEDLKFSFATNDVNDAYTNATDPTYDKACNGIADTNVAFWSIINTATTASADANGYFEFDHQPFPVYYTELVKAAAMTLTLTYGDNDAEVKKTTTEFEYGTDKSTVTTSWDLNWGNTGVVYKMTAHLFSDKAKQKENVSYPYVDWSTALLGGDGTKELDDYITIVEQTDTYIRFRINEDFEPAKDPTSGNSTEPEAAIQFSAKYQDTSVNVSSSAATHLMDMAPPTNIYISQKSEGEYVPVDDDTEIIYSYTLSDDKMGDKEGNLRTFYVTYGDYAGDSREVVWSLYDSDGNTIYSSDADAKATLGNDNTDTKDAKGNIIPSVAVEPRNSTAGDDYITLRCESLYDASVYDEVKIKVHLKATLIQFTPEEICVPVSTDLKSSSVKLASYLGLTPVDAWSTNYTWSVEWPDDSYAPGNWEKLYGEGAAYTAANDAVVYGQLNASTGELLVFEYATPTDHPAIVTVTDSVSGLHATMKVKVMDVDSPIGITDFEATNNLGYMNDTLKILDGLDPTNKTITSIDLYQSYDDAVAGKGTIFKTVTISSDIVSRFKVDGYFSIAAYSGKESLFKNEGGFIGVVVHYTVDGDESEHTSDVVPVQYEQEPNIVDGYVRLFGRDINSTQQAGIRIDLVGLNFKETVYTDSDGYFKFTKYIAPGTYTMTISKVNYLTRYIQTDSKGNGGITIPVNTESEKFHISTSSSPIYLYPGELTNDNAITIQDVTYYVSNWVGITDKTITNFTLYDFIEDGVISSKDLELLLMRKDWTNESYPTWTVPDQ